MDSTAFVDNLNAGIDRILTCADLYRSLIWCMLHTIFQNV